MFVRFRKLSNAGFEPAGGARNPFLSLLVDDINATVATLKERGVEFSGDVKDEPFGKLITILDPDGNEIIFHELKPADLVPQFNPATAQNVAHYLHEPTGRTVGHHQPAGDGKTHLFSPTGFFVATKNA